MAGNDPFFYDECTVCYSGTKETDVYGTGFLVHRIINNYILNMSRLMNVYAAYR
jgi:hypothetical protein